MGTGSGIIAIECARRGSFVTAVDIDPVVVDKLKKIAKSENLSIEVIQSDLFANVSGRYDTIIFNPPYLPGEPKDIVDRQWAGGGEHGDETIIEFLKHAGEHLFDNGEIYIILSSFNRLNLIFSFPYEFTKLAELKLAFHSIFLYRLKKRKA